MKITKALMGSMLTLACAAMPALAADNDTMTMAKETVWFPVQVVGMTSGCGFGIPICMVRRCAVRIHDFTVSAADKIGGHQNFPPVMFASLFGVPAGLLVGTSEGLYYGGRNGISHGWDKPFCPESFSCQTDVEK